MTKRVEVKTEMTAEMFYEQYRKANVFMERWIGNYKHELGSLSRFKDLPQLHEAVALQIHYYNTERIHSASGMSPAA